jgi:ClpP class serine protease
MKMYLVYQVVTAVLGFFPGGGGGSSSSGLGSSPSVASIYHPTALQHFMFEPVGYSYARTSPPFPLTMGAASWDTEVHGYYEKDSKALRQAMRAIPTYSNLTKIRPCTEEDENTNDKDDASNSTDQNNTVTTTTTTTCLLEENNETVDAETVCLPVVDLEEGGFTDTNDTITNVTLHKGFQATTTATTTKEKIGPGSVVVLDLRLGPFVLDDESSLLREAVTFLLGQMRDRKFYQIEAARKRNATCMAHPEERRFEVVVILESNGGSVSKYGLLAEQLRRIRNEPGMTLTVCCDEAALSGGYMLAALASPGQLFAAPFASVGSIGVITTETLNVHQVLERLGVKSFRFQAGEAKADISFLGEVRDDQMKQTQDRIDNIHEEFREHVYQLRGDVIQDFDATTNGNYWTGTSALKRGLVDRLITSDEYIDERVRAGDRVLKLRKFKKDGWVDSLWTGLGIGSDLKFQRSSWISSLVGSSAVTSETTIAQPSLLLEVLEILCIGGMAVFAKLVGRI